MSAVESKNEIPSNTAVVSGIHLAPVSATSSSNSSTLSRRGPSQSPRGAGAGAGAGAGIVGLAPIPGSPPGSASGSSAPASPFLLPGNSSGSIPRRPRSGSASGPNINTIPMPLNLNSSPIPSSLPFVPNLNLNPNPINVNINVNTPPCTPEQNALPFLPPYSPKSEPRHPHLSSPSLSASSPSQPHQRAQANAVDNAVATERKRAKKLAQLEENYTAAQLKTALQKERSYSSRLAAELASLKSSAVYSHSEAEVHEEGRINCLMRRLDGLQREKGRIIVELEREEEMLTNTLQKKLFEVRREKEMLERQIGREREENEVLKGRLEGKEKEEEEEDR